MIPPKPANEKERLEALRRYEILDTPSEQEYDDIALLAAQICGTPSATITMIDENRQWHKAKVGVDVDETEREIAFCAYTILENPPQPLVINDALKDPRFLDNRLVKGDPFVRFYAGAPLVTPDNHAIGTICAIDTEPRTLSAQQIEALQALARQVTLKLELRRMSILLKEANKDLHDLSTQDDLTGLFNRRGFLFHAEQQLKVFRSRKSDKGLWLLFADIDGLKRINDLYGHAEGSFAIVKSGELMKKTFREADIIARLGGDEFVALILNVIEGTSGKVIERLDENIAEYNQHSEKQYPISISYGLVPIEFDSSETIEETMKTADKMMYQQKNEKIKTR